MCGPFRNGACDAIKSRMACSALTEMRSIAGRSALGARTASMRSACCAAQKNSKTYATTQLPTINQVGYSLSSNNSSALRAVQSSPWKQCKKGAPPKPNVSGFGGERRSSGTTELLPRKAKRRMWSLRRRGTPFSSIFRRAAKDGVPEGRWSRRAVSEKWSVSS